MIIYPQGGACRRTGTQYLDASWTTESAVRIIPFVKSKTESYIVIFTLTAGTTYGIWVWDVTNKVYVTVSNTFFNTTDFPTYSRFTGYTSAEQLQEIQYAQYGSAIFFAQKDNPPFALDFSTITTDTTAYIFPFWGYATIGRRGTAGALISPSSAEIANAWPYLDSNATTTITLQASAVNGLGTMTETAGISLGAAHVGSLVRLTGDNAVTTGVAVVTGIITEEQFSYRVLRNFSNLNPYYVWSISSWSNAQGWPKALTFFEDRIYYAYTFGQPNGVWGSLIGNLARLRQAPYIDESLTPTARDAWSFLIPGGEFSTIQWLAKGRTLFIGTLGGEYIATGSDQSLSFGPLNAGVTNDTAYGSAAVQPIRRDSILIFVQRSGRMLREVVFSRDEDSYKAPKIMTMAEHMVRKTQERLNGAGLTNGQIVEMGHQESDNQISWFRDSNGGIFGMSRDRDVDGQPTGFHYHQIAGVTPATAGAKILSFCIAPSADGTHDDIYVAVRRSWASGPDRTYFEKMGRQYEGSTIYDPLFYELEDKPIYCDSAAISTEDPAQLTHRGFDHLYQSGQVVQVIADGHYVGEKTVDVDGIITLDVAAGEVIAGMKYRSQLIPTQIAQGSVIGTANGEDKTVDQIFIRFIRSIGAKFGMAFGSVIDEGQMADIEFRDPDANQNDPIDLFTGEKEITPPLGWHTKINIVIRQDLPFPQHVACIVNRGVGND